MTVLVTGATGTVGRDVARGLAEAGEAVRCATTSHGHRGSPDLPGESVAFDFTDPSTYGPALAGVDRIFLVRPPAISNVARDIRPFVLAAARGPIRLVVFLSLMGVNRVMPHWRIEQDLGAAGLPATMLRPAFFTQNLATAYRADIAEHDRIRLPAGSGRTSFVDTLDVARAAVVALRDPARCVGLAYTLTGPRAWTYDEVASLLSAELGRPIHYERVGFLRYRAELRARGLPADYVRVQLLINAIARVGLAARVTDSYRELTGRPATALPETVHRLREAWQ